MYLLCCEVFRPELEWLAPEFPDAPAIRYLEQGLHDHPDELRRQARAAIREQETQGAARIILGYGLCGRSLTGVTSRRATLVMPRVHDCIPVLLGCAQNELNGVSRDGSTYWMSPGWLRYSQLEFIRTRRERYDDYLQRFGSENADFLMAQERQWLASYTNACLIRQEGFPRQAEVERDARLVAEDSGLPYRSTAGRTDFLRALLAGGRDERFLTLLPGQTPDVDADGGLVAVAAE